MEGAEWKDNRLGRKAIAKRVRFGVLGTGYGSISGLFVQDQLLQAPMESADPRLILLEGSYPWEAIQAWRIEV